MVNPSRLFLYIICAILTVFICNKYLEITTKEKYDYSLPIRYREDVYIGGLTYEYTENLLTEQICLLLLETIKRYDKDAIIMTKIFVQRNKDILTIGVTIRSVKLKNTAIFEILIWQQEKYLTVIQHSFSNYSLFKDVYGYECAKNKINILFPNLVTYRINIPRKEP